MIAVKDILGEAVTEEVTAAWAEAYGFLADIFIAREAQIYAEQAAAEGGWNGYRRFVVDRVVPESDVITSFYLKPADGGALPPFKPGQYITVKVDHPETPTSPRNYSLSDRPGLGHYRISVKREPALSPGAPDGLISNYLHDQVKEGDFLEVGPPCGEFTLDPAAVLKRPVALLSGGVGITPVMSMLKTLAHHQVDTPIHFLHAARNSRHHAFADEVRALAEAHPNIQVHVRYDAPLDDDVADRRCDSAGFVDQALLDAFLPGKDVDVYFCGPKPFMQGVHRQLREWGVDQSQVHYEFFGPKGDLG